MGFVLGAFGVSCWIYLLVRGFSKKPVFEQFMNCESAFHKIIFEIFFKSTIIQDQLLPHWITKVVWLREWLPRVKVKFMVSHRSGTTKRDNGNKKFAYANSVIYNIYNFHRRSVIINILDLLSAHLDYRSTKFF